MKTLSLDLETYSSVDLGKSLVYRYVESPDFDILLLGFSADGSPVQVVDLAQGEQIPTEVIDALTDDTVSKWAFNASFVAVANTTTGLKRKCVCVAVTGVKQLAKLVRG